MAVYTELILNEQIQVLFPLPEKRLRLGFEFGGRLNR